MMKSDFLIPHDITPQSLERFLATEMQIDYLTIRHWIQAGHVTVDQAAAKASRFVQPGQLISVRPPPPAVHPAEPEALELPIRYADADLVVVAKPAGMATHPGPGWWHGSCVNALLHALDWPGIGGVAGPGIVHRLDRDTSGLLIFARSDAAHQALLQAMRQRAIERRYLAWVTGELTGSGTIEAALARDPEDERWVVVDPHGKSAVTHYRTLLVRNGLSLLALRLSTGRLNQIRVHLAHIGHPVWGDPLYGKAEDFMALHAAELIFAHPLSGEALTFHEPPPASWQILGDLPASLEWP